MRVGDDPRAAGLRRTHGHHGRAAVEALRRAGAIVVGHTNMPTLTVTGMHPRSEPLTVAGTGTQTRSLCYIDDLVRGLVAVAASGHPGPMNFGNPEELSVAAVARAVLAVTGSDSPVAHVDAAPDDPRRRCPDITAATRLLGWRPLVPLSDGLRHTVAWLRDRALGTLDHRR